MIAACMAEVVADVTPSPAVTSISSVATVWTTMLAAVRNKPFAALFSLTAVCLMIADLGLDLGNAMILRTTSVRGGSISLVALGIGLVAVGTFTGREGLGRAIALGA